MTAIAPLRSLLKNIFMALSQSINDCSKSIDGLQIIQLQCNAMAPKETSHSNISTNFTLNSMNKFKLI